MIFYNNYKYYIMSNIYISLTSIFNNQSELLKTLISVKNQTEQPSRCYIYLSEEKYLLDNGFKNREITNNNLKKYIEKNNSLFEIKWVRNIGPYRKLLPLLKEKWNEDCLIITLDDDTEYTENLIYNMKKDYEEYNCVINYRGFTLKKENNLFGYNNRDKFTKNCLYNFFTGKGGVLYHPSFFHKTNELIFNEELFINCCKTTDDVWFNFIRICNNISCFIDNKKYMHNDNTTKYGLFVNINSKNEVNSTNMKKCMIILRSLNYII